MYVPNANGTELKQKAIAPKVQKQSPKDKQMCPKPTAPTCTKSDCTKSVQKTIAKKQRLSKCAPKLPTQNLTKSDSTNRYKKQSPKTQVQTATPPPPPPSNKRRSTTNSDWICKTNHNNPGKKGRKTRERTITAQSCCPQQGKDKDQRLFRCCSAAPSKIETSKFAKKA